MIFNCSCSIFVQILRLTPFLPTLLPNKICCSAQQEQRQQIQGVAPLSLDTQTLSVSSSSSSSPSVSTCSLQPPPPPHLGSLIPPSSPFGSTSSSETSSSSSTKSSYTLRYRTIHIHSSPSNVCKRRIISFHSHIMGEENHNLCCVSSPILPNLYDLHFLLT